MTINFDMDGTIANLYGVNNWLEYLLNEDTTPYEIAEPMMNFSLLARMLNKAQRNGNEIAIISWTCKNGTEKYNTAVANAKIAWLNKHLPSVKWNAINVVPYGYNKANFANSSDDILFDDEEPNRIAWTGKAYGVENIIEILKKI